MLVIIKQKFDDRKSLFNIMDRLYEAYSNVDDFSDISLFKKTDPSALTLVVELGNRKTVRIANVSEQNT